MKKCTGNWPNTLKRVKTPKKIATLKRKESQKKKTIYPKRGGGNNTVVSTGPFNPTEPIIERDNTFTFFLATLMMSVVAMNVFIH